MALAKFQLEEISGQIDPYAIKNFIISDRSVYIPPVSANFPFVLDGVAFAICIGGNARVKINFREYNIDKNTIITILPFYVVEYLERTDDLLVEFLIFSVDFMTEMPQSSSGLDISKSLTEYPCLKISEEEADKYLEFHSFIVKQYKRRDHPFRPAMAKGLLYALLTEIGAIYYNKYQEINFKNSGSISHQEDIVTRFFKLLLEHHKTEKTLQYYADKMFLTPKYLSTVVKDRTGRTAFSWINEALVTSTKFMLKTTDMTVLQISEELNFPNPSFFGRFFKKHTGMTPLQYRES